MHNLEISGNAILAYAELQQISQLICSREDPLRQYQISLACVDSETMERYNRLYRGKSGTTDVLSFIGPELNPEQELEGRNAESKGLPLLWCDIIIDIKQLYAQKGTRTIEEEFRTVFIHGLLHVVGYDHIRVQDKKEMEDKEDYYHNLLVREK